jgi:spermidine synthase
MWLHLDLQLIKPLVNSISKTYSSVEYAFTTIPSYPSGQLGFIVTIKGVQSCKVPVREPTAEFQKSLNYYTSDVHRAAFVLPAFCHRAVYGDDK